MKSGQDVILENLQQLADKLENIQANVRCSCLTLAFYFYSNIKHFYQIVSNPEIMAHSKIAIQKVKNIVCRMNTVKHKKNSDEIASMLPLRTLAAVQKVEKKLGTPDFAQELVTN